MTALHLPTPRNGVTMTLGSDLFLVVEEPAPGDDSRAVTARDSGGNLLTTLAVIGSDARRIHGVMPAVIQQAAATALRMFPDHLI